MGMEDDAFLTAQDPPAIPTMVLCTCCGEEFESWQLVWRDGVRGSAGSWGCPMEGCRGVGFLGDIWPTDPDWRDENGRRVGMFGLGGFGGGEMEGFEVGGEWGEDGEDWEEDSEDDSEDWADDWSDFESEDKDLDLLEGLICDVEDEDEEEFDADKYFGECWGGRLGGDDEMDYFDE